MSDYKDTLETYASEAAALDAADPLKPFAARFYKQPGRLYFDGNSLGLLSHDAEACILRVLDDWKRLAVEGWTEATLPWFFLSEQIAAQVTPLVGATPESVIVTGSTTANLHQLLATLYTPDSPRTQILTDTLAFPSDVYAIQSHLRLRGKDPATETVFVPSHDTRTLRTEDILAALTDRVQLAVLPSVLYTSGQLLDMPTITKAARERGITIGWDLSHSIGVIPHHLDTIDADFAFWCHYKYLNAGPGAVGGLYLNGRHFGTTPGIAGWFGSDKSAQFDMAHTFTPAPGAGALQVGTPHLLSLAPLAGTLQITHDAGIEAIRQKSLALTAFLRRLIETELFPLGISLITPQADHERGGHLALTHPDAVRIARALRAENVIPDFRAPDILRLAPIPLYNSFQECVNVVHILKRLLIESRYTRFDAARDIVA